jgi:hypothetical protein
MKQEREANSQQSIEKASDYIAVALVFWFLLILSIIGYQLYCLGIIDGTISIFKWCWTHPWWTLFLVAITFTLALLGAGETDSGEKTGKEEGLEEVSQSSNAIERAYSVTTVDPDAEKRLNSAIGFFGLEWEHRPQVVCPECNVAGFVVAKIPGMLSSNKWRCCNCEAEDDGTLDGIDGRAAGRLNDAKRDNWIHKPFVVCSHCEVRGFVVFKKTFWGGKSYRKCCNCEILEELRQ